MVLWVTAALAWTPSDVEAELIRSLSARDAPPPCAVLEVGLPDPAASFEAIVEHVAMPPWAPMHAAACLIEGHGGSRRATLEAWLADPGRKGLARLVVNRLHLLDAADASHLAGKALAGPHAEDARVNLLRSPSPAVRELAPR